MYLIAVVIVVDLVGPRADDAIDSEVQLWSVDLEYFPQFGGQVVIFAHCILILRFVFQFLVL